ncbi:MAG: PcfB family protein [Clostridia bacterium]|nr:PcfB family protein [Clostridia bacterium]
MNMGGDVADQMVKFYLEGFEVLAKLSGKGAEHTIALLLNVMKDRRQTKGKARLNTMLKSGKPLSIFTINRKDLKKFATEAKRYGVLYSALIDRFDKSQDGLVDIMVRQEDASKINRIVKRFNLTTSNDTQIKTEVQKSLEEKGKPIQKEGQTPENEIKMEVLTKKENDVSKVGINKAPNEKESVKETLTDILIDSKTPKTSNKERTQKDVMRELQLRKEAKERMQILNKEDIDTRNFNQAKVVTNPQSEPYSKISKEGSRNSVRKELSDIKKEMDLKSKQDKSKAKVKTNIKKKSKER